MGLPCSHVLAATLRPVVQKCTRGRNMVHHRCLLARNVDPPAVLLEIGPIRFYTSSPSEMEDDRVVGRLYSSDGCTSTGGSSSHAKIGPYDKGVQLYRQGQQASIDDYVFLQALKACSSAEDLVTGKMIHAHVMDGGLDSNALVSSALIGMYARCGSLEDAQRVFDRLPTKGNLSWSALILAYALHGDGWVAIRLFDQMRSEGNQPGKNILVSVLKVCSRLAGLQQGRLLHAYAIRNGLEADVFIGSSLIDMYAKCGRLDDARKVFDGLSTKNLVTWNAMISGYAHHGDNHVVLELFKQMQQVGMLPDKVTLVGILKACSSGVSLDQGRLVHAQILQSGYELDVFLGTTLIDMYAKCGSLLEAHSVFDTLTVKNLVTWNSMIAGYAQNGEGDAALRLFRCMLQRGIQPNRVTFITILKACSLVRDLYEGEQVHVEIIKSGLSSDVVVASSLIDMYVKCGDLECAHNLFDRLQKRNSVTWNALISGYAQNGQSWQALCLAQEMQQEGMQPDKVTLVSLLKACSGIAALDHAKVLHSHLLQHGLETDVYIGSTLIDLYADCGDLDNARRVFDRMQTKNVVVWNALISAYSQQWGGTEAFQLFLQMHEDGVQADVVTFTSILKGCSSVVALDIGKLLHASIMTMPFASSELISSSLVTMYAKCGSLEDARRLFDSSLLKGPQLWSALIGAYIENGCFEEAFELFQQMQGGIILDEGVLINVLKACSGVAALEWGKLMHSQIAGNILESNILFSNTVMDMYTKCGNLPDANMVFESLQTRDLVSWNTIIAGCTQSRDPHRAMQLFHMMQHEGIQPDGVTLVSLLQACSNAAALNWGKMVHAHILGEGLEMDLFLGSAVVGMYVKCGNLKEASRVFNSLPTRGLASWNSIIGGYAKNGDPEEAFCLFENMQQEGVQPDRVTFLCLLSACSHAGSVDKGYSIFRSMFEVFNIRPDIEHYTCMIDLLGRAGHLLEAKDLIGKIPSQPDVVVWLSFLGACQIHGKIDLGRLAFEHVLSLDSTNAAAYSLMSNIYAEAGRLVDNADLRRSMADAAVNKQPGCTWMESDNRLHCFMADDRQHPEGRQVFVGLKALIGRSKHDRLFKGHLFYKEKVIEKILKSF